MITLYNMDVMKALKQMPSESVDMQICSPPYWGLRDYGVEGQIGLEPDFNDYIKRMCDIFDEVKRVLKKDGTCWINLGDTYSSTGDHTKELRDKYAYAQDAVMTPSHKAKGLPSKCLVCIPERFALAMVDRGWILRNKIIWHKPNHMPTSVKDRFANSWEYLFMFVKSNKNLFWTNNKTGKLVTKQPLGIQGKEKVDWEWRKCLNCKGNGCKSCKDLGKKKHNFWDGHCYYFDLDAVREPHKEGTPQADNDLKRMMSGRQEFKGIRSDCKYCGGTGIDPGTMNQCEDCKGKGRLHSVQKSFVAGDPKGRNPDDIISASPQSLKQKGWVNNPGHQFTHTRQYAQGTNNDFWDITTHPYKEAHFAVFPEKLVERPIKTTKKNAVILDIFAGSGTTLKVARDLKRDAIGIEIKKSYCDLIYKRLFGENQQTLVKSFKLIK